jgi:hypothetical protein
MLEQLQNDPAIILNQNDIDQIAVGGFDIFGQGDAPQMPILTYFINMP